MAGTRLWLRFWVVSRDVGCMGRLACCPGATTATSSLGIGLALLYVLSGRHLAAPIEARISLSIGFLCLLL